MPWIAANHRKEGAVSVSAVRQTWRPMDATTIEQPHQPRRCVPMQTLENPNDVAHKSSVVNWVHFVK